MSRFDQQSLPVTVYLHSYVAFLTTFLGTLGRFPFSQNFRNFRFGRKRNTFRRFVPLENSQKKWKIKKVGPFSRLEFANGMSCSIYVSRSLYQFQVHGRAPRRTGVYDQMEQLFTDRKFHFYSHRDFRVFFLNGKRPAYVLPNANWSIVSICK